jgi:predicted small lipoprotein YifL
MRILLGLMIATLLLSACGKKAPLRPPGEQPEKSRASD